MDRVQILQVKSRFDATGLYPGKWYCISEDHDKTRYLRRNGEWGDAASYPNSEFYFNSESEVKSTLARNHSCTTVSHEEQQESFTPSHESHDDDDDSSSSFGLGSIGELFSGDSTSFTGGGGDFGGGGAGGDW
jgi:uncharacterized membrane protein YgcG